MFDGAEGIYFDGHTSSPFKVSVGFDKSHTKIVFESEQVTRREWHISEVVPDLTGGKITIRPLLDSEKTLIVDDGIFSEKFFEHFRKTGRGNFYHRFIHAGSLLHIGIVLFIVALIAAAYFFLVPWLSEKAVTMLPVSYDESLGRTYYDNLMSLEKIDSGRTEVLNEFAKQISFNAGRSLNFTVVESKEINAFALPDGNIVVFSGILKEIDTYQQLSALLAHEASHVIYRHSMKELCRSVSGLIIISIISSDANGIMAVLAGHANNLNNLSYSRSFEKEADEKGFRFLVKNNIDPHGMLELFEVLKKNETAEVPEFLSTHPLTNARIANARKLIESGSFDVQENEVLKEKFLQLKMGK